MRKNIYDILTSQGIDLQREYSRIYEMFYLQSYSDGFYSATLYGHISENFSQLNRSLIHRCLSIEDFDETYGYSFDEQPVDFNIDYLVSFSEYVTNFVYALLNIGVLGFSENNLINYLHHIKECMEDIGYEFIDKEGIVIFVERDPNATAVAEITKEEISLSVLEYNHHKLKGDLTAKKNILKNFADDIELEKGRLKGVNNNFTNDLFQLLNKFIRHDSSNNKYISNMDNSEIEKVYDEIYQMWLLAKMQLEYVDRKPFIKSVLESING